MRSGGGLRRRTRPPSYLPVGESGLCCEPPFPAPLAGSDHRRARNLRWSALFYGSLRDGGVPREGEQGRVALIANVLIAAARTFAAHAQLMTPSAHAIRACHQSTSVRLCLALLLSATLGGAPVPVPVPVRMAARLLPSTKHRPLSMPLRGRQTPSSHQPTPCMQCGVRD